MGNERRSVELLAASYPHDFGHSRQVSRLSEELFDSLVSLHMLGNDEREFLVYAALLHDIGWSEGQEKHHKRSYELILLNPPPFLSPRAAKICANIARYHRKSLPKRSHAGFMKLKPTDRDIVCKLASILRIADGLDATHRDVCKIDRCRITPEEVVIFVSAVDDCSVEIESALSKSDFFEQVFDRRVAFEYHMEGIK